MFVVAKYDELAPPTQRIIDGMIFCTEYNRIKLNVQFQDGREQYVGDVPKLVEHLRALYTNDMQGVGQNHFNWETVDDGILYTVRRALKEMVPGQKTSLSPDKLEQLKDLANELTNLPYLSSGTQVYVDPKKIVSKVVEIGRNADIGKSR